MNITPKQIQILQVSFNLKDFISRVDPLLYQNSIGPNCKYETDYEFILSIYNIIQENSNDLEQLKTDLQDYMQESFDELEIGSLDYNCGSLLSLASCILLRLEILTKPSKVTLSNLPKFAEEF